MSGLCHVAPVACYQLPMPVRRTAFGDSSRSVMNTWMAALSLERAPGTLKSEKPGPKSKRRPWLPCGKGASQTAKAIPRRPIQLQAKLDTSTE